MADYPKIEPLAAVLRRQREQARPKPVPAPAPEPVKPAPEPRRKPKPVKIPAGMLSLSEVARRLNGGDRVRRRLSAQCTAGEISGATMIRGRWYIPASVVPSLRKPAGTHWTPAEDAVIVTATRADLARLAKRFDRTPKAIEERWLKLTREARQLQPGELRVEEAVHCLGVARKTAENWDRFGMPWRAAIIDGHHARAIHRDALQAFMLTRPDLFPVYKLNRQACEAAGIDIKPLLELTAQIACKGITCPHCPHVDRIWTSLYSMNTRCPSCSERVSAVVAHPVFSPVKEANIRPRAQRAVLEQLGKASPLRCLDLMQRTRETRDTINHALRSLVRDRLIVQSGPFYRLSEVTCSE